MCRLNIDGKELNDKLFYSLVRKHYTDKEKTGRRPGEQEEEKMELTGLGLRLVEARQAKRMTQEELAVKLGVTAQAVSKWERGAGLPDVPLLASAAEVLEVSTDYLLGITIENLSESGRSDDMAETMKLILAEPLTLSFGVGLFPVVSKANQDGFPQIQKLRKRYAEEKGWLIPTIRIRDEIKFGEYEYQIMVYEEVAESGTLSEEAEFEELVLALERAVASHYARLLNRQVVKRLLDYVRMYYPAAIDGIVPERISYQKIQRELRKRVQEGKSIRSLLEILEELEELEEEARLGE